MQVPCKSIVFIGFKNVGKSTVGCKLASQLGLPFIDLDEEIERTFENEHLEKTSCREIMKARGEVYFRDLENRVLAGIIQSELSVISLGGGSLEDEKNQKLIKEKIVVHLKAPRNIVFQRIMAQGRPLFFSIQESPLDSFNRLWDEREKVYKKLAAISIDNDGSIEVSVDNILNLLRVLCWK